MLNIEIDVMNVEKEVISPVIVREEEVQEEADVAEAEAEVEVDQEAEAQHTEREEVAAGTCMF